jgi:SAM-dependent methyltransferase
VNSDPRIIESHRRLLDLLPSWFPELDPAHRASVRITGGGVEADGERLVYRIDPAERLGLPDGAVDITLSHSVLEHVRAIDQAIAEIARVTAPGGVGLHQVDFADHIHDGEPLRMLEVSGRMWDLMADRRRGWTNRLRLPALAERFARAGLEATGIHVTKSIDAARLAGLRPRLHPDFRDLPDAALTPLTALLVLRRR